MEPLSASARERTPGAAVQYLGAAPAGHERDGELRLLAPNRYVIEWLARTPCRGSRSWCGPLPRIRPSEVVLDVGTRAGITAPVVAVNGAHEASAERAGARAPPCARRFSERRSIPALPSTASSRERAISLPRPPRFKWREIPARAYNPLVHLRRRRPRQNPSHACRRQQTEGAQFRSAARLCAQRAIRERHGEVPAAQHHQ